MPFAFFLHRRDLHRTATRLTVAALLAAAALTVVGVPGINLHGPLHFLGIMDPLCGGTRAAYLFSHSRWTEAWRYNPIVFPLAFTAALLLVRAVVGWVTGRWLTVQVTRPRVLFAILALAIAVLEVRQQLHADLLTADWTGLAQ